MKNLLIICFICISTISFGQSNLLDNVPKKTWKIVIKNNKTIKENFQLIGEKLIENDFSIEKKDNEFVILNVKVEMENPYGNIISARKCFVRLQNSLHKRTF